MNEFGLIKNMTASAAILPRRIVKFTATEGEVAEAAANTDLLLGVTGPRGAAAIGDRVDVYLDGIRDVEFGGVVTQGDFVTSDASGKAIAAAPAAGVNEVVIGRAMVSAVAGDIGSILIQPGRIQG